MKNQNQSLSAKFNKTISTLTPEFYWIFLPNGVYINMHDEKDYSQYLHNNYESKSNQGL